MNSKAEFFVVRRGATALPNSLIHDSGLSYAALALLTVCLSLPAGAQAGYRPSRPLRVVGEPREEMTGVERAELVERLRGNTALPSGMRAQLADRLENSSVPGLSHPVSGEDSPFQGRERKPDSPTKGARKKAQG